MNVKSVSTPVLKTIEWDQEEMRRGLEQGKHFRKEEEVNKLKNQILCTEVVFPLAQMATQHAHTHIRRACRDAKNHSLPCPQWPQQ